MVRVHAGHARDGDLSAGRRYVIGLKAPGTILALPEAPQPPGPNGFGRVILETPDAKALEDTEGNSIELYTPPRP